MSEQGFWSRVWTGGVSGAQSSSSWRAPSYQAPSYQPTSFQVPGAQAYGTPAIGGTGASDVSAGVRGSGQQPSLFTFASGGQVSIDTTNPYVSSYYNIGPTQPPVVEAPQAVAFANPETAGDAFAPAPGAGLLDDSWLMPASSSPASGRFSAGAPVVAPEPAPASTNLPVIAGIGSYGLSQEMRPVADGPRAAPTSAMPADGMRASAVPGSALTSDEAAAVRYGQQAFSRIIEMAERPVYDALGDLVSRVDTEATATIAGVRVFLDSARSRAAASPSPATTPAADGLPAPGADSDAEAAHRGAEFFEERSRHFAERHAESSAETAAWRKTEADKKAAESPTSGPAAPAEVAAEGKSGRSPLSLRSSADEVLVADPLAESKFADSEALGRDMEAEPAAPAKKRTFEDAMLGMVEKWAEDGTPVDPNVFLTLKMAELLGGKGDGDVEAVRSSQIDAAVGIGAQVAKLKDLRHGIAQKSQPKLETYLGDLDNLADDIAALSAQAGNLDLSTAVRAMRAQEAAGLMREYRTLQAQAKSAPVRGGFMNLWKGTGATGPTELDWLAIGQVLVAASPFVMFALEQNLAKDREKRLMNFQMAMREQDRAHDLEMLNIRGQQALALQGSVNEGSGGGSTGASSNISLGGAFSG